MLPLMPSVLQAHCEEMHSIHAAPGVRTEGVAAAQRVPPRTKHHGVTPSWKWSSHCE